MIELHPNQIPDDLKKYFKPKRKYGPWIIRNCIIWHKPNPMPSSAKDRFTVDYEVVWFMVKSRKYWFEPQYEPLSDPERQNFQSGKRTFGENKDRNDNDLGIRSKNYSFPLGRNKRTVWTIPTQPFPEAHFATFPEKLVEPMIKAGCPEFVCTKCGKAREKVYDREVVHNRPNTRPDANVRPDNYERIPSDWKPKETKCLGYTDCGCNADWKPGVMLEPFCGSGTALQVAARLRRDWVGVELKPEYIKMAEKRARQGETGLSVKEQKQGQQPLFPVETKK